MPVITCSAIPAASADGTCQAAVPNVLRSVTVSDTCSAASAITLTQTPAAGTLVGLGVHTITVTATDAAGNSDSCSTTFTVIEGTIAASVPGDQIVCQGSDASFLTVASGVGPFECKWRLDGNTVGTNGPTLTLPTADLAPGDHALTVEVRGLCGPAVTNAATLTIRESITANAPT